MTSESDIITPFDDAPELVESEAPAGTNLDAVRDLVLRAHPDAVPEMVAGDSVDALLASIEPARAAWRQVADRIGASPAPVVPAGGQPAVAVDPDRLSASEKIRRGLARNG